MLTRRVALSCLEAGMSKHLGYVADIGASLEQQGGHAVAEQVATAPSC